MKLIKKGINIIKHQNFQPSWVAIFINPFFISRRALYKKIKTEAPFFEGNLLDFGCGRKPYKDLFKNVRSYVGVDINISGHNNSESDVDIYYDGKILPFSDETFNCIFSSEVFEHIFNIDEILDEINRVLVPNGKILFTTPFSIGEHEKPFDFGRYTSFGWQYILEERGFKVLKIEKTNHYAGALSQLFINYMYSFFYSKNRVLNTCLTVVFLSPLSIFAYFLSSILPKNYDLYSNLVILAEKTNNCD